MTPLRRWFLSLRPYFFTASLIPIVLSTVVAVSSEQTISWWALPLYAIAALLIHSGTNVLNDYYDYRHDVDGPEDGDPTHTITQGIVTSRFMVISGHLYFLLAIAIGSVIATVRGPWYLMSGLVGTAGAYFYTNARFSLKYRGLGDLSVFVLMGPALVAMGQWSLTGTVTWLSVILSLPPTFLVTAILHGNNLRDLETDRHAGIRTVAGALGREGAKKFFVLLLTGAYLITALLVFLAYTPPHVLIVLLSLPLARRIIAPVVGVSDSSQNSKDGPGDAALTTLPAQTAALHFLFSLLFIGGLLLGRV